MNMKYYNLLAILVFFGMIACSGEKKGDSAKEETVETVLPDETNEVTVMTLKTTDFNHELVSNGKLPAVMSTCGSKRPNRSLPSL